MAIYSASLIGERMEKLFGASGSASPVGPDVDPFSGVAGSKTDTTPLNKRNMSLESSLEQIFLSTRFACLYLEPVSLSLTEANLAAQRLFGFKRESLVTKNLGQITLNDKSQLAKDMSLASSGKKRGILLNIRDARTGAMTELLASVIPVTSGAAAGRVAVVIPLSHGDAAEREKDDDFITAMMEAMSDGAVLMGGSGVVMAYNWKFQQMWRIPRMLLEKGQEKELLAHMASQIREGENLAENPLEILDSGGEDNQTRLALKDGRTMEIIRRSVAPAGDNKSWIVSFKDVSSVFEAEKMLYETLQELGAVIDASRMGVVFVKKGKITRVSHLAEQMLGYARGELEGLTAQDLFSKEKTDAAALSGSVDSLQDGVFMSERLFVRKNGTKFWAMLTVRALDHKAPAAGAVWVIEDITERKRADEKIRMSTTVFENINEGIIITNIKGEIQFVNPAFSKVTGFSPDEVYGKRPSMLKSGRHDKDFYHDMWKRLVDIGSWQGEVWNRRKNGEIYAEWLSITAMKNAHGETTHYTGIFSDITYRKDNEDLVRHLAFHDPLTHLPNRRMFLERMDVELAHAKRNSAMVALFFLDLDNFKDVNDTLGHNAGDMVLMAAAERIKKCLRESDAVARIGGDEFTVLAPKISSQEDAAAIADKIIEALSSQPIVIGEATVKVCTSMGVSLYPKDGLTGEDLTNKADRAMYFAKKQGKGFYKFYDFRDML